MAIDFTLPLGPFRDALKTLAGSIVASLLVSMVGGFLAFLLTYWDVTYLSEWLTILLLGWVTQWVVACLMLWGFLFLALQCLGLHSLIHGSRDPLFILGLMFTNQVFVSIVALLTYDNNQIAYHRPLIAGGAFFALMAFALWTLHKKTRCRTQ